MSLTQIAQASGLPRVGARPPLHRYLAEVWSRRDFVVTMARYRTRAEVEENRLGIAWVVLRPLINAAIYGLIFGLIQGANKPANYTPYVVVGVFMFELFQSCFNDGSKAITGNRELVQSLNFPRLTLPLSFVVQRFQGLMIMMAVLIPILIAFKCYPTWRWLLMIPLLALYTMFCTGIALISARLTVHVTDLTQLLPFISRIAFFSSGVLFAVDKVLQPHPHVLAFYNVYPIYQVLELSRWILVGEGRHPAFFWPVLTFSSVVTLIVGVIFFWRAEERYGRD